MCPGTRAKEEKGIKLVEVHMKATHFTLYDFAKFKSFYFIPTIPYFYNETFRLLIVFKKHCDTAYLNLFAPSSLFLFLFTLQRKEITKEGTHY